MNNTNKLYLTKHDQRLTTVTCDPCNLTKHDPTGLNVLDFARFEILGGDTGGAIVCPQCNQAFLSCGWSEILPFSEPPKFRGLGPMGFRVVASD